MSKAVKVEVVKPFERYKIGDKPELSALKASTLEKMGLVKVTKPAKAEKPAA